MTRTLERSDVNLAVEEVTTTAGLEGLREEWADLWCGCPGATPFQTPAWLIPWWRHIGEGDLWTLALRCDGRLVGLAPLYVYGGDPSAGRQVFPLGIATTDYLDPLFAPGFAGRGAAAVLAHLDGRRDRWDLCDFRQLRPGSTLMEAPAPGGWSDWPMADEPCPALPLPGTAAELSRCLPARLRDNLRYYERRAGKAGPLSVERATGETLEELFAALVRLHAARWSARGEDGVLARPEVQAAHREALPGLLALGVLRLYGLRLDGRLIAAYYGFADAAGPDRRAYFYLGGFDPEFGHLSPGTLILAHAVREAVREGARTFDFLRGEESYKYLWGARDAPTARRRLAHPGDGDA